MIVSAPGSVENVSKLVVEAATAIVCPVAVELHVSLDEIVSMLVGVTSVWMRNVPQGKKGRGLSAMNKDVIMILTVVGSVASAKRA